MIETHTNHPKERDGLAVRAPLILKKWFANFARPCLMLLRRVALKSRDLSKAEETTAHRTSLVSAVTLHNGCIARAFGPPTEPDAFQPLQIETDVEVYSYAASFALPGPLEFGDVADPWLIADIEVTSGAIWIGCTTADYSAYVDREVFVPAGNRRKAYVPLGRSRNGSHAMFRNDNLEGRSVFCIYELSIRTTTAAETAEAHMRALDPLCLDVPYDKSVTQGFASREGAPLPQSFASFEQSSNPQTDVKTANAKDGSAISYQGHGKNNPHRHQPARRIGGMATMPSRANSFELALASVLPQIDRLYLYLDKCVDVPNELKDHPKIVPLLPSTYGDWGASGKLLGTRLHHEPCFYFCFDDDILYPPDYVDVMTQALNRYDLRAVVGIHACRLKPPYLSFRRDRDVVEFRKPLAVDCYWDILGTGTIAFHTDVFKLDPTTWRYNDMADLMVGIEAAKHELPRISIRRPKNYLRPLDRQQPDSIYVRLANDDTRETAIMRQALRSCSLSWSFSPIALRDELDVGKATFIDTIHGVAAWGDGPLLTHTGLADTDRFIGQLCNRRNPYVPLGAALRGEGDALTIDDSTVAARKAALIARRHGHAVTMFLNGYNISERTPYHFSRLSAAIDSTKLQSVSYEEHVYDLQTLAGKQRFRSAVKKRVDQLGSEQDRQAFISEIGALLGIHKIVIPSWLEPISPDDVRELFAEGVNIQNHGWTHSPIGSLHPDDYASNIRQGREWLKDVCGTRADRFAVPNGDGLPLWANSSDYCTWLMLDQRRPFGELASGVFNRRILPT